MKTFLMGFGIWLGVCAAGIALKLWWIGHIDRLWNGRRR